LSAVTDKRFPSLERLGRTARGNKIHRGIDMVDRLLGDLGQPHRAYPVVHVGGTNGKGSVTYKVASALRAEGLKVGLTISPHLVTCRERIQINGIPVSAETLADLLDAVFAVSDRLGADPTFFEVVTAAAFLHFSREQVDVAAVEVGLGGRWDATNVVVPAVAVVTSVDLDHCDLLGCTREAIAAEKAGIVKEGIPLVLGPHAQGVGIEEIAHRRRAPITLVKIETPDYRLENTAVAKAALEVLSVRSESIEAARAAELPGRFEVVRRDFPLVLDVAHNAHGLRRLLTTLEYHFPHQPLSLVVGFSRGKDLSAALSELRGIATLHVVTAAHPRLLSTEELRSEVENTGLPVASVGSVSSVLGNLLENPPPGVVAVCGSCFLMAEAGKLLERAWATLPCAQGEQELIPLVG
jgi:dihydrofolate synthase / folylpolyglutamate synthase